MLLIIPQTSLNDPTAITLYLFATLIMSLSFGSFESKNRYGAYRQLCVTFKCVSWTALNRNAYWVSNAKHNYSDINIGSSSLG
jgi:hypothetical protein